MSNDQTRVGPANPSAAAASDDPTRLGPAKPAPEPAPDDETRVRPARPEEAPADPAPAAGAPRQPTEPPVSVRGSVGTASFGLPRAGEVGEIQIGEILGFTYRIEALLGKGGMGAVYRARHGLLDTEHAVKVILPEYANEEDIVARMTREAITLHDVNNDAVVEYEGFFLDEKGRRYLVMEYVDGPSLAAVLKQQRLSPDEVRVLRNRLALGLAAAHDQNVLHRDLSPDNVILPGGKIERAKIIDFGIAKSKKGGQQTVVGAGFIGKYSYASPEQFDEEIEPDGRADIYSLGLVLAAASIGFGGKLNMGNSLASAVKARQAVPDLSAVDAELRDELAKMLQPHREDRTQTMRELVPAGEGTLHPAHVTVIPAQGRRRGGVGGIIVLLLVLVLLAGGGAGLHVMYPAFLIRLVGADAPVIKGQVDRTLAAARCSALESEVRQDYRFQTHVRIGGVVPTEADLTTVVNNVRALPNVTDVALGEVEIMDWPFCEVGKLQRTVRAGGGAFGMTSKRPDFSFKDGEAYEFAVTPKGDGFLYVDLVDPGGEVLHLFPQERAPENHVAGGSVVAVASNNLAVVGPPFGKQMVMALVTKQPLFNAPRRQLENTATYLESLRNAVTSLRERDGTAVALEYRLFETSGQ